jgi:hypothetical protein
MRVAILDIVSDTLLGGRAGRVYGIYFRKQFMGITPQAIAVWCRYAELLPAQARCPVLEGPAPAAEVARKRAAKVAA